MNMKQYLRWSIVTCFSLVSLCSFSQDLIARQAPIDKKLKAIDG